MPIRQHGRELLFPGMPFMIGVTRRVVSSASYVGPGDVLSGATAFYGLRAYSAAYAAAGSEAIDLRRSHDNATMTAVFLSTGDLDKATISSWAGADTIFVSKLYDQTGHGNHIIQATAGNQPTLLLSPLCVQTTASVIALSQSVAPSSAVMSLTLVGNRSAGTGTAVFARNAGSSSNNRFSTGTIANQWRLVGATGSQTINVTASDAAWHAGVAILNGASAVVSIDGTETTGTSTGNTSTGTRGISGAVGNTVQMREFGIWEGLAMSAGQRTAMIANMNGYAW